MASTTAVPPVVQLGTTVVTSINKSDGGDAIVSCLEKLHPLASIIFTVYVPKLIILKV